MPKNIGHNGGPPMDPHDALKAHIDDLVELAEGCLTGNPIATQEQADQVAQLQKDIKTAKADADKARKAEKEPHLEAGKAVDAKYKPLIDKADLAASVAAKALTPWLLEQQRQRDEAAAAKRAEAERLQAEARAKLAQAAETGLEAQREVEQAFKDARKAEAQANRSDRQATGLRTYWEHEIQDFGACLRWLKMHRPGDLKEAISELVRREVNAGQRKIDGVDIRQVKRAV